MYTALAKLFTRIMQLIWLTAKTFKNTNNDFPVLFALLEALSNSKIINPEKRVLLAAESADL